MGRGALPAAIRARLLIDREPSPGRLVPITGRHWTDRRQALAGLGSIAASSTARCWCWSLRVFVSELRCLRRLAAAAGLRPALVHAPAPRDAGSSHDLVGRPLGLNPPFRRARSPRPPNSRPWADYGAFWPLPHPFGRNNDGFKRNLGFGARLMPRHRAACRRSRARSAARYQKTLGSRITAPPKQTGPS